MATVTIEARDRHGGIRAVRGCECPSCVRSSQMVVTNPSTAASQDLQRFVRSDLRRDLALCRSL
jgi:hypothetical protein